MNTRGLVELVALNIGYDLGILSPAIFTMLVIMALITTFLTGPLLDLAKHLARQRRPAIHARLLNTPLMSAAQCSEKITIETNLEIRK
jgi:Kef-type K+ transport system membrane component KefB